MWTGTSSRCPRGTPPGYLRVEVGFDDPAAQTLIPPTVAGTSTPRPDLLPVGYVAVGPLPSAPSLDPAPQLADEIRVIGGRVGDTAPDGDAPPHIEIAPGDALPLTVAWQAIRPPRADYTMLIHLIGSDGVPVVQWDRPPLSGVIPSTLWREGEPLIDAMTLSLPADVATGQLHAGHRPLRPGDAGSAARHAADGVPAGDTIPVATVTIR